MFVTANVVELYTGICHGPNQKHFVKGSPKKWNSPKLPIEDIVWMVDFVLKIFFEFNSKIKRQKSRKAVDTKFASPYACIFMDEVAPEFLKSQELQPFL